MRTIALFLVPPLFCVVGCAQVLGLDAYGPAGDGSADATEPPPFEGGHESAAMDGTNGGDARSMLDSGAAADGSAIETSSDAPQTLDASSGPDGADDAVADSGDLFDGPCTGVFGCVPAPPPGWTGPVALWEGSGGPPGCDTGFAPVFDGGNSPSSGTAQCTCGCGGATGVTCGPATLTFTKGCPAADCAGGRLALPATGACSAVNLGAGCKAAMVGVAASGSVSTGGSCDPVASTTVPPWTWANTAAACSVASQAPAGCSVGQQCIPLPVAPFESRLCVLQQGTVSCPAGEYTVQHLYYAEVTDTRGCTTCSCGSPTGVDCDSNAHVDVWTSGGCGSGGTKAADLHPIPVACANTAQLQGSNVGGASFTSTPIGGSCVPSGGQPTGTVAPANPVTICCQP